METTTTITKRALATEVWLSVEDAAKRLGIKSRRMLDYADKIPSQKVPNPRSGKSVLMFEQAGVDKLIEERKRIADAGLARGPSTAIAVPQQASMPRGDGAIALPQQGVVRLEFVRVRSGWLTISQAAQQMQTAESVIQQMIASGKLPALDLGKGRRGGRFRINQAALDRLA